jgi:uncharacterized delta-60 repeat protein
MATSWHLRRRPAAVRSWRPSVEPLEARQLLSAGALDPTFGSGGKVGGAFSALSKSDVATGVAVQPDGKIVVVGTTTGAGGTGDFAALRLNADGTPDAGFGSGGRVVIPFDLGGNNEDDASAVALQPDGKIVLAGEASVATGSRFAAARLDPNGSLDATFGTGGKATFAVNAGGSVDIATGVAVQPDGRIVLAGRAAIDNTPHFAFAAVRLNANGTLDGTFSGGTVTVPIMFAGTNNAESEGMALQADGKIILAGFAGQNSFGAGQHVFAAARLNTNGSLDNSFAGTGTVTIPFNPGGSEAAVANAVAVQPDGKIVLAGSAMTAASPLILAVARLSSSGAPDGTFGSAGQVTVPFSGGEARAVAVQPNGKIVLAGLATGNMGKIFATARLTVNGALDSAFDDSGIAFLTFGSLNDEARAVALQADGKILLAGLSQTGNPAAFTFTFVVARLTGDVVPPPPPAPPGTPTPPGVSGVQVLRGGRAGKVQGLVVTFTEALDPASAQNFGHYTLLVPGKGKGKKKKPRHVPILSAVYNPATHAVTLTLGKLKSTDTQGMLQVTGVTDPAGDVLGGTAVFAVNLSPKRKH